MFRKVLATMENAAVKAKLRKGGLPCPECGEKAAGMTGASGQVMQCGACGAKASFSEWAAASDTGFRSGRAGEPPQGTKIRMTGDGLGGRVWEIPAKGKFGFFMPFAVMWLMITGLVSGGFLFTFLTGGEIKGDMPKWALIPFFGLFWAIGLGMLYAGLREKYLTNRITVSGGELKLRKELFGKVKEKGLPAAGIREVAQKEFYKQNYQPVYGIEIRGDGGKLRFGSGLGDEEKAWLVAELRQAVFGKPEVKQAAATAAGVLEPIRLNRAKEVFSVAIPAGGAAAVIGGMVFLLFGIGFICIGVFLIEGEPLPDLSGESGAGYWFSLATFLFTNGFRTFWVLFSSVFAVIGIFAAMAALRDLGSDRRIEGNSSDISIRTYRRGLILKDKSFPRNQVTDIRTSESGSSGNTKMKRVELIVGDKAEKIASWMDGEKADSLAAEVRQAMGFRPV